MKAIQRLGVLFMSLVLLLTSVCVPAKATTIDEAVLTTEPATEVLPADEAVISADSEVPADPEEEALPIEEAESVVAEDLPVMQVQETAVTIEAEGTCGDNLTWTLDTEGNMHLSGNGPISYYKITWNQYKDQIVTLTIEEGVTGNVCGFSDCTNLVSVSLPNTVTSVSDFYGCISLETINLPQSVTEITKNAFYECSSLKNIQLPDQLITLGSNCFAYCKNLEEIYIPASVENFGATVFNGCPKLDGFWVDPANSYLANDASGVLFTKDMTTLLDAPDSLADHYTIPDTVSTVRDRAFSGSSKMTGITLPSTITEIDFETFSNCTSLVSITFPENLKVIGTFAFDNCTNLQTIWFTGIAPIEISESFAGVTATVYYPADKDNWTEDVLLDYGGTLTWKPYRLDGDHIYIATITAPTCTTQGYITYTCSTCGDSYTETYTAIAEHAYGDWSVTQEATCTGTGIETRTCQNCSLSETKTTPATGHNYVNDICGLCGAKSVAAPVVKLSTVTSSGKIKISWSAVEGAVKYHIYRATDKNGEYTLLETVSETSFTDNSATPGVTYYYYAVAETEDGTLSGSSAIHSCVCDLARPVVTLSNSTTSGKIKISWEAVDGAKEYKVYRSLTGKSGSWSRIYTSTKTSITNTSAKAGTKYYYKVIAVHSNSAANSAYSSVKSRTCDLPRPVVTLSNVASSGKVKVSWDAIEGAKEYKVYRSLTGKSGSWTRIYIGTKTSITDTSAETGTLYYYKVIAIHSKSAANSAYSSVKSRRCDLPRPVITLSNSATSGKIKISWEAIDGAEKYQVYRSTDGKNWSRLITTTKTSLTNTSATAGTLYYYKVKAIHSISTANSAYSSVKSLTCDLATPKVSINITCTGKPWLTWNAVEGAVSYKVYRATSSSGKYSLVATVTDYPRYIDTSAKSGKTYYYQVLAVCQNTDGNSAKSTAVSKKATKGITVDKYAMAACALDTCYEFARYPSSVKLVKAYYTSCNPAGYPLVVLECSAPDDYGVYAPIYITALYLRESDYSDEFLEFSHIVYHGDGYYVACTVFVTDPYEDYDGFSKLDVKKVKQEYNNTVFG